MRGAVVALLAVFMLSLGFFAGLSVNPLQPAITKVVTSTVTITALSISPQEPTVITSSSMESRAYFVTQTVTAYVSKTITEIVEKASSIIEFMKETVTTWLTKYMSITETITEKTTQTVTTIATSYITLPRTITMTSTATLTSYTTFTSTITSTKTATTYVTSTSTTTLTSHTTLTSTITSTKTAITYVESTSTTTTTVYTTETVTTTKTTESFGIEGAEIDLVATVYKVIDGDTFDAFPSGRVRLADINAPELDEAGGQEAKNALINLVLNKKVYLDVDDVQVMDKYYRLVCVVFIDYNSTHVLNVNKWLIENGYAEITDYENEFDPNTWTLYNKKM